MSQSTEATQRTSNSKLDKTNTNNTNNINNIYNERTSNNSKLNKEIDNIIKNNESSSEKSSSKLSICSSKTRVPHQIRYKSKISYNNKSHSEKSISIMNTHLYNNFFNDIVEGEYKRKEPYISEQHEGWQPILTESFNIKII
jgi:hypothetical protein